MEQESKYTALRIISGIFKVIGVIIPLIGIGIVAEIHYIPTTIIIWSVGLILMGLIFYAQGEFIRLFVDIEANTRK